MLGDVNIPPPPCLPPGQIVKSATKPFAICIDDTDYKASLIRGKV